MQPIISVNYFAIFTCVALAMVLGFLWFGPLFGKRWAGHMGMADIEAPGGQQMAKSMALFALGNFLIVYVLVHSLKVWMASSWGLSPDAEPYVYALNGAMFTWLGFFVPLQIGRVAWEMKRWGLVAINASFDLTRLLVFSFVLVYWP